MAGRLSAGATAFDRDTAVEALGEGRYGVSFEARWWVVAGPNGGHVAAMLVRALRAEARAEERALRSLTVHFPSAPREGPAEVAVRVERSGRGLTTASARLVQGDRLCALALGAFAVDYPAATEYDALARPDVPEPEAIAPPEGRAFAPPPFAGNFVMRPALGPAPFSGGDRALTGGWLRLAEDRPLDEALVVALTDSWWPAPFGVVERPMVAPTVDLTVHLVAPLPRPAGDTLLELRSDVARGGFFTEDAALWARDGTLLAQARQLALAL